MSIIIKPSHNHTSNQFEDQEISEKTLPIFNTMLSQSEALLNTQAIQEIQKKRQYFERKIYVSFTNHQSQYLVHMISKSQNVSGDYIAELINDRINNVLNGIESNKYQVRANNQQQKIKRIKDQLTSKLSQMKHNFDSFGDPVKDQQKANEIYKAYMEFRKRGYWNQQSEQSKKVKEFLDKMKKQKKNMEQLHQKNLQQIEEQIKNSVLNQKKMQQQQQKKILEFIIRRREKIKNDRKQKKEEHIKKLADASSLIQKVKVQKLVYLNNEEKFKKEMQMIEQQRKRKLNEIKKSRKPLSTQQMQEHEKKYEQMRQKMMQAYNRREQENEIHDKNYQKLKQLFHGHYHEKIQEQALTYQNLIQQKKKNRNKIISYSAGVQEQFKPKIDPKKKEQFEKNLKMLELKSQEPGKKKIKHQDGSITFQQINPHDAKKLGVSYLEQLRNFNQGRVKIQPQERSVSMMELSKIGKSKIIYPDYLKQMRSKSRAEIATAKPRSSSKSGWRKILREQSFSNRDKYSSVMDHVSHLQIEAKQKQKQLRNIKNIDRRVELKQKLDKYYLESLNAKMHVLKEVILKQ